MNRYRVTPYARTQLKQVVWRFKDVEELPEGFTRDVIIHSPEDLFTNYKFLFDDLTTEKFVVFILNSGNHVQAIDIVSEGILNSSLVHPRETFRGAILGSAASIIVAHNHPSGNPEPSNEDLQITRQLVEAGKILGIPVHDHLIFTKTAFTSFAERGLL